MLYLFVKNAPADGILRLPGLSAASIAGAKAYLLGDPSKKPLAWTSNASQDAMLSIPSLEELQQRIAVPAGEDSAIVQYLPVIAIPLRGTLSVKQPAFSPDAQGAFSFTAKQADHFFNYNGYGYEDPATLYKLRWNLAAKPGKYRLVVEHAALDKTTHAEVVIDGHRTPLDLKPSETSTTIAVSLTGNHTNTSLEITPPEPFYKGTKLEGGITAVQLILQP